MRTYPKITLLFYAAVSCINTNAQPIRSIGYYTLNRTTIQEISKTFQHSKNISFYGNNQQYYDQNSFDERRYGETKSVRYVEIESDTFNGLEFSDIKLKFYQDTLVAFTAECPILFFNAYKVKNGPAKLTTASRKYIRGAIDKYEKMEYKLGPISNVFLKSLWGVRLVVTDRQKENEITDAYSQDVKMQHIEKENLAIELLNGNYQTPIKSQNDITTAVIQSVRPFDLKKVSRAMQVDTIIIYKLNPDESHDPETGKYNISIPVEKLDLYIQNKSELQK